MPGETAGSGTKGVRMFGKRKVAAVAVAAWALVGCGGGDEGSSPPASTAAAAEAPEVDVPADFLQQLRQAPSAAEVISFVGKVEGTDAYVAVVQDGDAVTAYVCDGADVVEWLTGTASGAELQASNPNVTLGGTRADLTVTGTVRIAGEEHAFTAANGPYGVDLFQALAFEDGKLWRAGWIVLADGTQRGAAKAGTEIAQAGAVDVGEQSAEPLGDGSSTAATPSQPEPFKKEKSTKTPKPPTIEQTCANLEVRFDTGMEVVNSDTAKPDIKKTAGNGATEAFRQARELGCPWVNQYLTPSQTT